MRGLFSTMRMGVLGGLSVLAASCADPQCLAEVDRCLQRCPPEGTEPEDAARPGDTRDSCERRCHQKCHW